MFYMSHSISSLSSAHYDESVLTEKVNFCEQFDQNMETSLILSVPDYYSVHDVLHMYCIK